MKPINLSAIREYNLTSDTNKSIKFQIGSLDIFLRAYIDDKYTGDKGRITAPHARFIEFCKYGLKGWDWKDEAGTPVPFLTEEVEVPGVGKRTAVKDETLNQLSLENVIELGLYVVDNNYLFRADQKNS